MTSDAASLELAIGAQGWIEQLANRGGIAFASEPRAYQHAEDGYDTQYGVESTIETTIGKLVVDALGKVPQSVLEIGCGSGHFTASLLHDGRVPFVVASDGSPRFLEITGKKVQQFADRAKINLLCISDDDFDKIPADAFDAIIMRSVLHHFVDFRGVAELLISKLRPGGALCMLEPRADFHIMTSLVLKGAALRAKEMGVAWDASYDHMCQLYMDMTKFYCDRKLDKALAEDKYAFHIEEFAEIAAQTGTILTCVGAEYPAPFSAQVKSFLNHCMNYDRNKVADILTCVDDDLNWLDQIHEGRPRYGAAEWFIFRKP